MSDENTLLQPVLADLADVFDKVTPEQYTDPTPCPGFDVGAVRDHIHGWLTYFAQALQDPSGEQGRVDPKAAPAPHDPAEAAAAVRAAATSIAGAAASGPGERGVTFVQAEMPANMVIGMALMEYQMHGWDLARGAGLPWRPAEAASAAALQFAHGMLSPEYRGEGKDFGEIVEVGDDAPTLEQLLGFAGRDPGWTPPAG